jgi:hypothetical protein
MSEHEAAAFAAGWDAAQGLAMPDDALLVELMALAYLAGQADARAALGQETPPIDVHADAAPLLHAARSLARKVRP